ncbi:MAG TPA: NAD(P)/FAD-dependent oxidoreductase [Gemmatimonadota bacterium]|nr:NAD(P)/FAD-dependent oxidoreductase [Gemmatimonadota bacterium]
MDRTVVIGAGPAGLAAAHELSILGRDATVLEQDDQVGGIARTVVYRGYRFDIGGHRFFTKARAIQQLWEEVMGDDFLVRPRLSRIHYNDHFFHYPLKPVEALIGLGPLEALRILASYVRARTFPIEDERTFEEWVVNRFGRRLFEIFFQTYTEKVWGRPCSEIGAEWAAQRIKNLDLVTAVRNALLGARGDGEVVTTLIDRFHYPRLGPGMLWERWSERLAERGVEIRMQAEVTRLLHRDGRVVAVEARRSDGTTDRVEGEHFISTMSVRELIRALSPSPPAEVAEAAERLEYRDFLTVVLIVDVEELFPDNWIYIHSPDVRVGRIQNFKNWSPDMVPDASMTSLGLEYFVHEGDDLWSLPDPELIDLGARETARLGLVAEGTVRDGTVVRVRKAYPVYDGGYREALATIRGWLASLENLQLVGRNGQHRYNNQDHSMLTGILAARNVAGEDHDIWSVNVDEEYHEAAAASDRLTPATARERSLEEVLAAAFARYDPLALGAAVGVVFGVGLFLATTIALLAEPGDPGRVLSLFGQYLLGYEVSWVGAGIGLLGAGIGGFAFGWLLARAINGLIGWQELLLRRQIVARTLDPLEAVPR